MIAAAMNHRVDYISKAMQMPGIIETALLLLQEVTYRKL